MPPKRKRGKAVQTKSASKRVQNVSNDRDLRPKKSTDFRALNSGKTAAKRSKLAEDASDGIATSDDAMSLTNHTSDDDLDADQLTAAGSRTDSNQSNSAQPLGESVESTDDTSCKASRKRDSSQSNISKEVAKAMKKYFQDMERSKSKKGRSKKTRKRQSSSESSSGTDSTDSTSGSASYDSTSSDDYEDRDHHERKRKRKKDSRSKRRSKKRLRSKSPMLSQSHASESTSMVYTRGCKSPVQVSPNRSSDSEDQYTEHIPSDADTEEVIESLN